MSTPDTLPDRASARSERPAPAGRPAGPARRELARKGLHVAAAAAAAAVAAGLPPTHARASLAAAVGLACAIELARIRGPAFRELFVRLFGPLLRPDELRGLSGATTLAVGCAAAVFLFPPQLAAIGCLYAGFADAAAAIAGRRFGRRRLPSGSSAPGAAAFFLTAAALGWATPILAFAPALLAAALATALETLTPRRFDNLVVPVGGTAAVLLVLHFVS